MAATSPGIGMSSWLALHIIPVCTLPQATHPSTLCMGTIHHLPVDILCGTFQKDDISHCEYVANLQKRLGHVFEKVREKTGQSLV